MKRYFNRHTYALAFFLVFFLFVALLAVKIQGNATLPLDVFVKNHLQAFSDENGIVFFKKVTKLGSFIGIVITLCVSTVGFAMSRMYGTMVTFIVAVVMTDFINGWLKHVFQRPRPSINKAFDALGYSFPSGHAMLIIVTYGFLAVIFFRYAKHTMLQATTIIMAIVIILMVGMSRIVLSVHYPSDVLGGYCAGGMLLILFLYIEAYMRRLNQNA